MSSLETYIVGYGQTPYGAHANDSIVELVLEAVQKALSNSSLQHKDIDYVVTSSCDLWDGKTASNIAITEVVGAVMKGEVRISADGLMGVFHADNAIKSGEHETVLVVAHTKGSEGVHQAISQWTFDPLYLQPLGLDFHSMSKLVANIRGYTANDESLESFAAQDGACAVILSRNKSLANKEKPIKIGKKSTLLDVHYPGRRNLKDGHFHRALEQLNYSDLSKIECAALSANSVDEEKFYYDQLKAVGFAGHHIKTRATPFIVKGLSRLIDAASLMAKEKFQSALVHGQNGAAAQQECILLLEAANGN